MFLGVFLEAKLGLGPGWRLLGIHTQVFGFFLARSWLWLLLWLWVLDDVMTDMTRSLTHFFFFLAAYVVAALPTFFNTISTSP